MRRTLIVIVLIIVASPAFAGQGIIDVRAEQMARAQHQAALDRQAADIAMFQQQEFNRQTAEIDRELAKIDRELARLSRQRKWKDAFNAIGAGLGAGYVPYTPYAPYVNPYIQYPVHCRSQLIGTTWVYTTCE